METYNNDPSSQTNTILIVIVLVVLVGFGVWWYMDHKANSTEENPSGVNVNLTVPNGTNNNTPAPTGGSTNGY